MRSVIVSSDRLEDSELSDPLRQLQAKGVAVDIAAPQQRPIAGKHGNMVSAGLALNWQAFARSRPGGPFPERASGRK